MASNPINLDDSLDDVDCFGHRISTALPEPPKLHNTPSRVRCDMDDTASPVDIVKHVDRLTLQANPFVGLLRKPASSREQDLHKQSGREKSSSPAGERSSINTIGDWKEEEKEDTGTIKRYAKGFAKEAVGRDTCRPFVASSSFDGAIDKRKDRMRADSRGKEDNRSAKFPSHAATNSIDSATTWLGGAGGLTRTESMRSVAKNPFLTDYFSERRRGSESTAEDRDAGRGRALTRLHREKTQAQPRLDTPVFDQLDEDTDKSPGIGPLNIRPRTGSSQRSSPGPPLLMLSPEEYRQSGLAADHVKAKSFSSPRKVLESTGGKRHSKSMSSPEPKAIEITKAKLFANSSRTVDAVTPAPNVSKVNNAATSKLLGAVTPDQNVNPPSASKLLNTTTPDPNITKPPAKPPKTEPGIRHTSNPKKENIPISNNILHSAPPPFTNPQLLENRTLLSRQQVENAQRQQRQRTEAAQLAADLQEYYIISSEDLPPPRRDAVGNDTRSLREEVEKYAHDRLWADMNIKKLTSDVERLRYQLVMKEAQLLVEKEEHRKLKVKLIEAEYELLLMRQQEKVEKRH